jgi:hypothetical protein
LETAASTSPAIFKFVSTRLHVLQYFNIYLFRFSVTWIISLEECEVVHVYMG